MAKKKNLTPEQERKLKMNKLQKSYEYINEELHIQGLSINEQVHKLVDAACELFGDICIKSDDIKINDFQKVQELTPIDKKTYLDFVNICSLKNNDKLHDKAINKFSEDFSQRLFITNLRHSFLESYMNGDDLKITDEDNVEYKPFTDYKSDEFDKIMQDSAKKREYINIILWKKFKSYAKAAEYITDLELTYKDFKNLVDWQYYKDGGHPTPNSPSKLWNVFDKFNYTVRTLSKYGYEDVSHELNREFGLGIDFRTPQPTDHPWTINKEEQLDN